MNAELIKSYRAVICSYCNEPIAVSSKVVALQGEVGDGNTNVPHTFTVRCKMCEYERVYAIHDVRSFEGEPRRRSPKKRAARA